MQYVGQTSKRLKDRFRQHSYAIRNNSKYKTYLYQHFKYSGHSLKHISIHIVEQVSYPNGCSQSYKNILRHVRELDWIKKLQSPFPLGLNDNMYSTGNISRLPNLDVLSFYNPRKRKSRSHGIRKNHNIKRKSRTFITLNDLYNILINTGRHAMLSKLSSLSIPSLHKLFKATDSVILRTDPLYQTAVLVECYCKHYLSPHVDIEEYHRRYFLKIQFLNKGIDLINLPSIFSDKNVEKCIPAYFKYRETPMICYKYNKPIRNLIFNYNCVTKKETPNNTIPSLCECHKSPFFYPPVGHVITGNLDIVEHSQLKNLLYKGPKYRLPNKIDFDACVSEIHNSLELFCEKWCKRENAEISALTKWKSAILTCIRNKVNFYNRNPGHLPRHSNVSVKAMKHELELLHQKYVMAPADKAANNIVFI